MEELLAPASGRAGDRDPDPRALAQRMAGLKALGREKGYFRVPLWEQALRCIELVAVPTLAFALLATGGSAAFIGALLLALHYPRTAYLGHDVAHNHWGPREEPKSRLVLGALALFQGFGATWWIAKHELHHAFPNACRVSDTGILTPIDGDIDSAPWIVWDKFLAEYNSKARESRFGKLISLIMPRLQVPLFFPLLSVGRFNWSWQSIESAARDKNFGEAALCAGHWILGLTIAGFLTTGPVWAGWIWFLCANLFGGLILGIVFVLSHTGMEIYDASQAVGFYDRQARATRNTPSSLLLDWVTGGLNSQIEHHMFPTMARRNLTKMRAMTRKVMLECGYSYEQMTNREALRAVLSTLGEAARAK